jgi:hypothetical protein
VTAHIAGMPLEEQLLPMLPAIGLLVAALRTAVSARAHRRHRG